MLRTIFYYLFWKGKRKYVLYDVVNDTYIGNYRGDKYSTSKFSVGLYMTPYEVYHHAIIYNDAHDLLLGARDEDGEIKYVPVTNAVVNNLKERAAAYLNAGGLGGGR